MRPSVHRRASKPQMTIMKKSGRNKNSKICFIYCCYCYILEIWFSSPNKNPPRKGADGSPAIYSTRPPARTADAVDKESGSRCGKAPRTWKTPLRPENTLEPQLAQKQPARPPHTPPKTRSLPYQQGPRNPVAYRVNELNFGPKRRPICVCFPVILLHHMPLSPSTRSPLALAARSLSAVYQPAGPLHTPNATGLGSEQSGRRRGRARHG
jgi:hypothetical protein